MRSKQTAMSPEALAAIVEPARAHVARLVEQFAADVSGVVAELHSDLTMAALAGDPRARERMFRAAAPESLADPEIATRQSSTPSGSTIRTRRCAPPSTKESRRKVEPEHVQQLLHLIDLNPGLTMEQINRALGTTWKHWRAHLPRLIAERRIFAEGISRSRRYFPFGTNTTEVLPSGLVAVRADDSAPEPASPGERA
jgi:hypothetical protein